jgi:hypothetical protein
VGSIPPASILQPVDLPLDSVLKVAGVRFSGVPDPPTFAVDLVAELGKDDAYEASSVFLRGGCPNEGRLLPRDPAFVVAAEVTSIGATGFAGINRGGQSPSTPSSAWWISTPVRSFSSIKRALAATGRVLRPLGPSFRYRVLTATSRPRQKIRNRR